MAIMQPEAIHKITLTIGKTTLSATLFENPTARDFATTLPFEADMRDLFWQEKAGRTARALSTSGPAQRDFEVGDIGYWSPSTDVAIYYRDGDKLPSPGIIMIGKVDGDISVLRISGKVRVRFARAD
ncbi:cyclophilin-like fold protein [Sphingomonas sp. CFBP 13720]|uniref:cyclophilin-like fold protein n=1 Tax=Sphingomonas sp. CFBP 13720 TaxID=2775302 RepID=UPI0018DA18AA|nr:cyclophilin-like fold protein [Sphingomonas sp. CFBP 13720]